MLFSSDRVATFINNNFEPTWESTRPVPIVRIDFGNGNVVTRTLHGNVLTAVCSPEGTLLDALPGIYEETTYLDRINQLRLLAFNERQQAPQKRAAWLRAYHQRQAEALKKGLTPDRFAEALATVAVTKRVIERRVENLVAAKAPATQQKSLSADVARWPALAEDTRLNETARRRQIHELLARVGSVAPGAVTKTIYKDVLHADLDDPYLGLGKALFENYPFAAEDRRR